MALYQPTVVNQQQLIQQQQQWLALMNNANNGNNINNWNMIYNQQLLYSQQLYHYQPATIIMPVVQNQTITINNNNNNNNINNNGLSLNYANVAAVNNDNTNRTNDDLIDSPLATDAMSPKTISSLLSAPEFIPKKDENATKVLKANCNEFIPGITTTNLFKSKQLSVIHEDDDNDENMEIQQT